MGQEFVIKSTPLEDKINQLLPSQGGTGAGVDLSASTTIVPIIDLTETAEGSEVRADIQRALSLNSVSTFDVNNTTSTIITTTGYYKVFGTVNIRGNVTTNSSGGFQLTDGITTKTVIDYITGGVAEVQVIPFDFTVFIAAGQSLTCNSSRSDLIMRGVTRQIATITGELVDP